MTFEDGVRVACHLYEAGTPGEPVAVPIEEAIVASDVEVVA